jgi:hypothetical protein
VLPGSEGDEVCVAEGTLTYHCVKHHNSYRSTDFTSNLMKKVFPDSEIVRKLTSMQTKTEAVINHVISPRAVETVKASIANICFCGVVTDASNKLALKFSRLDLVFLLGKVWIANKTARCRQSK